MPLNDYYYCSINTIHWIVFSECNSVNPLDPYYLYWWILSIELHPPNRWANSIWNLFNFAKKKLRKFPQKRKFRTEIWLRKRLIEHFPLKSERKNLQQKKIPIEHSGNFILKIEISISDSLEINVSSPPLLSPALLSK